MKQINCIIVEDEIPAAEELKFLLNKYDFLNILAICSDGLTAMNIIKKHNPQAIFLDINIPVKNGMDLAKEIKDFNNDIQIIFVTAYEEHALEAFEIEALDYILKPFDEKRIDTTIRRLFNKFTEKQNNIELPKVIDEIMHQLTIQEQTVQKIPCENYGKIILVFTKRYFLLLY